MAVIEVCCPDMSAVRRAIGCRADRIELCRNLELDGLTPSREDMRQAVAECHAAGVKVHVLIRSRDGDFVYNADEVRQMADEIRVALEEGADGVVIGALTKEGEVDMPVCRGWIEAARAFTAASGSVRPLGIIFHRAFDVCRDMRQALEDIIALGCDRLLTSGHASSAFEGMPVLAELVKASDGRLKILAGAGVSAENYRQIMDMTGVGEVHGSFRGGIPVRDNV